MTRMTALGVFAALLVVFAAGGLVGVHALQAEGQLYTGCITSGGDITNIAVGDQPLKECKGNQLKITWNSTGPAGADGADGADGANGADGQDGADGLSCWDLNGDGVTDPDEDVNGDEAWDTLDCQGPAGADGTALSFYRRTVSDSFPTGTVAGNRITATVNCDSGDQALALTVFVGGETSDPSYPFRLLSYFQFQDHASFVWEWTGSESANPNGVDSIIMCVDLTP